MFLPPCRRQLAGKGFVQDRGAAQRERVAGRVKQIAGRAQLAEQRIELGDNPALLRERRQWKRHFSNVFR